MQASSEPWPKDPIAEAVSERALALLPLEPLRSSTPPLPPLPPCTGRAEWAEAGIRPSLFLRFLRSRRYGALLITSGGDAVYQHFKPQSSTIPIAGTCRAQAPELQIAGLVKAVQAVDTWSSRTTATSLLPARPGCFARRIGSEALLAAGTLPLDAHPRFG
ncbi:hypothetical protein S40285_09809 [Stachybotrys chlorohalonatus IBT 40285]|uniref:Uncharacterized protein n=1 Tax=Stachybotrys chlorohalonatus (strain IBT 40285) TaxID=1283841 RepID=A0A084QZ50_STAC4|nr:hypothetical protein S40285_09809 [Stachybotrys chlorohalonata IBT 40285]